MTLKYLSLKHKLLGLSVVAALLMALSAASITFYQEARDQKFEADSRLAHVEKFHSKAFSKRLWLLDYPYLKDAIEHLVTGEHLSFAAIYGGDGTLIHASGQSQASQVVSRSIDLTYWHNAKQVKIGSFRIEAHHLGWLQLAAERWQSIFFMYLIFASGLFFLFYFLHIRSVHTDLSALAKYASEVDLKGQTTAIDLVGISKKHFADERTILSHSLEGLVSRVFAEISQRNQAELDLEEQSALLQAVYEGIPDVIVTTDKERTIVSTNPAIQSTFGYNAAEVIGKKVAILYAEENDYQKQGEKRFNPQAPTSPEPYLVTYLRKDGVTFPSETIDVPIHNCSGEITGYIGVIRDVSQRIKGEQRLIQSQKMEAVGMLAGGVAHDFNNVLAILRGNIDIILRKQKNGRSFERNLENLNNATGRATDLVKQILTFSRQEEPELLPINLVSVVDESLKLMRSTIPTTVEIMNTVGNGTIHINADQTQFQQILINLCTNAVHAMDSKGLLTVNLEEVSLSHNEIAGIPNQQAGRYARLTITDTGTGMDEVTMARIFEPFFTTKDVGRGTGMGLPMAYGIVKSHGGFITVDSVLDQGTSFSIYFPIISSEAIELEIETGEPLLGGRESLLFVDDEKHIVGTCTELLLDLGYKVTSLTSSTEALALFKTDSGKFDLVLTDQTMPEMTGTELSSELLKIRPDIPIILCSGFSATTSENHAKMIGIREFAMKPLSISELSKILRKVLDEDVHSTLRA